MNELLYNMIFKRKSFHTFKNKEKHLSEEELIGIENVIKTLKPLDKDIDTDVKIVKREETTCKTGEYCILIYSEKKDNYLLNIGYLFEQLDLYLASKNIGCCWNGLGKTEMSTYNGLEYVIMLAIGKVEESEFQRDISKYKRREINEFWNGNEYLNIASSVQLTPSACNSQPWLVNVSSNELMVYRYRRENEKCALPVDISYFNKIDIGIFILFLELSLEHYDIKYKRNIFIDNYIEEKDKNLIAKYELN